MDTWHIEIIQPRSRQYLGEVNQNVGTIQSIPEEIVDHIAVFSVGDMRLQHHFLAPKRKLPLAPTTENPSKDNVFSENSRKVPQDLREPFRIDAPDHVVDTQASSRTSPEHLFETRQRSTRVYVKMKQSFHIAPGTDANLF